MTYLRLKRTTVIFGCLMLLPTISGTAEGIEQLDPTKPSSEIESLLAAEHPITNTQPKPARRETNPVTSFQPRLRGMVLRDSDHGTALISISNSQTQWVPLRRVQPNSPGNKVTLAGANFVVINFTESAIVLQSTDGSRQYVIQ